MSANCGVPVTVTDSLKVTAASSTSPAMWTPLAPCAPGAAVRSASPVTVGASVSREFPSTTASPSVTAWLPRPREASFPAASRIVPPFSASAFRATPMPFASASPAATVQRKSREEVPLPEA